MLSEIARSIQRLIFSPATLYLINCLKNAAPDCDAIQVALISKFVAPLGRASRRILAVLVDQQLPGAEYVGVVDHLALASNSFCTTFEAPAVREFVY
jgi:hypothetical protein